MTTKRVLVLDGHTTQALACVRSLGRAGHASLVASSRGWPLARWSRWCVGHFRVAAATRPAFADLRDWAREQGATTVLPMTEPSCLLCTADRRAWEAAGIMVGCGDDQMLARAFDKVQTLQAALACGVTIPPTLTPASAEESRAGAERLGYPCVVKSRFSHALIGSSFLQGGGASYVASAAHLDAAIQAHRQGPYWPIIQRFVAGRGKGVSGLCDQGRTVALFAHERLRDVRPTGSASSLRRSIPLDTRLRAPVERLLSELNWHGPVMVEFRDDGEDALWLMEVNGRFWGSVQLAISSGVDVPRWLLAMLEHRPVEPPAGYAEGVTLRWLWGDVKRFLRILQGPPLDYPGAYPSPLQGIRELFQTQPAGTRSETWDPADRWPAVGEWVQGIGDLVNHGLRLPRAERLPRERWPSVDERPSEGT